VPAIAVMAPGRDATLALRRTLPAGGSWQLLRCPSFRALEQMLAGRLVDAIVLTPTDATLGLLGPLRAAFPRVPWVGFAPFRPDDGTLLLACHQAQGAAVVVDGVDNPVAGDLVTRVSAAADRRRALADAPRMLRLAEPLQREVWDYLLERVDQPIRTASLARKLGVSREHLSRQFGAGGAPNLKRVIDLTRVACAAALLQNPGYDVATVARILRFSTASHLSATSRRIATASSRQLRGLGPRGVLVAFARSNTRSRM
jgi:AraC-like DNA-binding protein